MSAIRFLRLRRLAIALVLLVWAGYFGGVHAAVNDGLLVFDGSLTVVIVLAIYLCSVMVLTGQPRVLWLPGEESRTLTVIGIITFVALNAGTVWLVLERDVDVIGMAATGLVVSTLVSGLILACWPPVTVTERPLEARG